MKFLVSFILMLLTASPAYMQPADKVQITDSLPYYEIPEAPKKYTPETVVARMIDGLGFRYYWATEGLRPEDLSFKPSKEARTSDQTLDHILDLSTIIIHALRDEVNDFSKWDTTKLSFDVKRKRTLETLKTASDLLKSGKIKLKRCKVSFKNASKTNEYPFWNNINGPIEDAVWHTGQVVSFRRSSGNPYNPKADVFSGKLINDQ
jgi:hypothetical protein